MNGLDSIGGFVCGLAGAVVCAVIGWVGRMWRRIFYEA